MEITSILSWDVGIKHLAYNLSEYSCEESGKINLTIKQWGIINLSLEKCDFCDKDGLYLFEEDKKYYCSDHCKKLRVKHFCYVEKCYEKAKYNIEIPGTNKYICDAHGPKVYAFDSATELLKLKLIEKLDLIQFEEFQYVLIENQPTFKNPKMKAIADTLYSWFLIRKIVDAKTLLSTNIRLISPGRKNTLFVPKIVKPIKTKTKAKKEPVQEPEPVQEKVQEPERVVQEPELKVLEKSKKLTYQEGKKLSIEFCQSIITPEWNAYFKEFSKKDDLADCLLQGYSFFTMLIEEKTKQVKRDLREQKTKENKEIKANKKLKKNIL
jgi:hypothetical protein